MEDKPFLSAIHHELALDGELALVIIFGMEVFFTPKKWDSTGIAPQEYWVSEIM